jgi:adsorption protein B
VVETLAAALDWLDAGARALLVPVAVWILLSAGDDLIILAVRLVRRPAVRPPPEGQVERPIAIYVPCWHEAEVIARMLEHNLSAIRYRNYHWFVGAYPNDPETQRAVEGVMATHPNVHLAVAPHPGPTSKADCLNWVYQRMRQYEQETGARFEVIVQHDAEDLVHPQSLEWVNFYSRFFGMIQTPVLALPTPWQELTHGLYCDDFAYSHQVELPVRYLLGGFIPSAGVGTAYRRDALEALAEAESNRIFAPGCLTEDYEMGYQLHRLGVRQLFIPPALVEGKPVATREYFPRRFYSAFRQRTRWVTGIVFQGWQRHGWGKGWERYWFWRDRKGLVGNPLSLVANLLFVYGLVSEPLRWETGVALLPAEWWPLVASATAVGVAQLAARAYFTSRIYGWRFACGVVWRTVPGNLLNCWATATAALRFLRARVRGEPLVWVKTEHQYPSIAALEAHKRPLGEILVAAGYVTAEQLRETVRRMPAGASLEEWVAESGLLTDEQLCEALALQSHLPAARLDPEMIRRAVARSLPVQVVKQHQVLPVWVKEGVMGLATPRPPTTELEAELQVLTSLNTEFVLVPADNFRALCEALLDEQEEKQARGAGAE